MITALVNRSGTTTLTPNGWLVWHPLPERPAEALPPEWVFRVWRAVDLDRDEHLLALLDMHGMLWGSLLRLRDEETTPSQAPLPQLPRKDDPDAVTHLAVVREHLVTLRALATMATAGSMPDKFWRLLDKGLAPFTPVVVLSDKAAVVDLYEAGCWQVFGALTAGLEPKQCPECGWMFYRKDGTSRRRDARYCTSRCSSVASSRRHRERNHAAVTR